MGESKNDPLRLDFDRQLKLEFHSSTVASDAGLLAYRELDDALALTCPAATGLHDTRTGATHDASARSEKMVRAIARATAGEMVGILRRPRWQAD
jgi:hypothetical protein